jgi:hypothetical protein
MASGRHRRARSVILPADTLGVFPRTVKRTIGMTPETIRQAHRYCR